MPNWCYNTTLVHGPQEERKRFLKEIEEQGQYHITNIVPMPEALEGTESPSPSSPEPHPNWIKMLEAGEMSQSWYDELCSNQIKRYEAGVRAKAATGYRDWYEWANAVWGTKWGDCETSVESDEDSLRLTYNTAWGPFDPSFWEKVSTAFPLLSFITFGTEESNAFVYCYAFINGYEVFSIEDDVNCFTEIEDDEERWDKTSDWETEWIDARSAEAFDAVSKYGELARTDRG